MKLIALTAALALGTAAYAQDMSTQTPAGDGMATQEGAMPTQDTTMPTQDQSMANQGTTPPADPSAQQMPMTSGATDGAMATGNQTAGGYMPSTPPLSGTPTAGATVRVQPSMSPSQAFPPPAPKSEYPICKKGQTDGCRQRGG